MGGCSGFTYGNYGGQQEAFIAVHDGYGPLFYSYIGDFTSNESELIAIQAGLTFAKPGDTIFSDSQLAVNFLRTRRSKRLHLQNRIDKILVPEDIGIKWTRREENCAGHFLELNRDLIASALQPAPDWLCSTFSAPQGAQKQPTLWKRAS